MSEKSRDKIYYSQGEYVSFFGREHTGMGILRAVQVATIAKGIIENENIKPRSIKSDRGLVTVKYPKHVWEQAYKEYTNE